MFWASENHSARASCQAVRRCEGESGQRREDRSEQYLGPLVSQRPTHLMRLKKGGNKNKAVAKGDLPTKECVVCKRPFTW